MNLPYISVVIPVHNEAEVLYTLYTRLTTVMDQLKKPYEIIFTNDGSKDNSEAILNELHKNRPHNIRIIHFNGNYGQHMAIMAGFEKVRGQIVITMDADLQNLPEDIPSFIEKIEQGHDVVGGFRENRQDSFWRVCFSKLHNKIRARITPRITMKDEGCMLRAYRREIVDLMVSSGEASTFIPALALTYAGNPAEVPVSHEPRHAGTSSYNFYRLIRYNFDLITGFSLVPLQLFTLLGIVISVLSGFLVIYMILRRTIIGPEMEGIFTLFAIIFFLVGLCLLGLGVLGEYIGRIYQEVLKRPRFVIKNVMEQNQEVVKTPTIENITVS
ncbi:MAG: glycosyltransferase [Gammaproteobacteria bacterium]|nr:glycosyltransferase [Gammaproteobacteria bacterium]